MMLKPHLVKTYNKAAGMYMWVARHPKEFIDQYLTTSNQQWLFDEQYQELFQKAINWAYKQNQLLEQQKYPELVK